MFFRNLQIYRFVGEVSRYWSAPLTLSWKLDKYTFVGCGAYDHQTRGWCDPCWYLDGYRVYTRDKQVLLALRVEEKKLPGDVVRRHTADRAAKIEAEQGFKPGRRQMREIREAVENDLLPHVFGRQRTTHAWIDAINGWLVVDAANPAKADELLEMLHKSVGGLTVQRPQTVLTPVTAMTNWLLADDAPTGFTIDRDSELVSPSEEHATVRFVRHPLDAADIRHHIEAGKFATRLALTWNDQISFVLTDDFQIRRVNFLDILKENAAKADNMEEQFDADFALMTGELARLITDLIEALGGEKAHQAEGG